ncbi:MAG: pyridoxine 5'-phosphate synthase [Crocinitomicaceae bacterium]|nr:pyridoxine 5'-phosphate synthase [Crocinitomicaceae bacterium]MDG2465390.1 pyridoxine 5'-phosphate synthase [Crocinitomicaceae bacterium]
MTKLSVNINKIATLRNARGGATPNVVQFAQDCERFGAQGITVHPRPDERHITLKDTYDLAEVVTTEYNIEGYPDARFQKIISDLKPTQATLVPDPPNVLTSDAGWDTIKNKDLLTDLIVGYRELGIRSAVFIEPDLKMIEGAKAIGVDRIEFYTGPFADNFKVDKNKAVADYVAAAHLCNELGIGINAGHDLSLENLAFFKSKISGLLEVSIGHALISDALYFGIENTIQMYLKELNIE